MEKIKKYVNVYTEANPNPNSLKFMLNFMLLPEGVSMDFPSAKEAEKSPLATELFMNFDFIERVFLMNNFVTVTKKADVEWEEIARGIKLHIQAYCEDEKPILTKEGIQNIEVPQGQEDTEITLKIKQILEEYIRPAVETDGGAIHFHSFDEATGVVKVLLQGACSGCPSSTVTLKAGIENLLKRMMPEVQSVVSENM